MDYLKPVTAIFLGLMIPAVSYLTLAAAEVGLNSGFNNPYHDIPNREWREQPQKIADGWNYFYVEENTYPGSGNASKLRWMSSAQFASAFGGIDYHIEGDQSQNLWTSYDFEGGVYQQIGGVTPGQAYGFDIAMVTFWRGPGYGDSDGKMVRQVGIDPFGGTDPSSSTVVWSDTNADDKKWVYMDVAAVAQAVTITVFAKVQAPENDSFNHTDLNMVYFDAAHIDVAPTAAISASVDGTTIDANWVGVSAPGWSIKGFEFQYRDQAGGEWVTLQSKNQSNTQISVEGQAGHTYSVRVRPWQRKAESYNSDIDMPGVWAETEVTVGTAVAGRVFNYAGLGLSGVTVSVTGTLTATTSTSSGNYILPIGSAGEFSIVAADFEGLVAPPPISVTVLPNAVTTLDISLRPAGDEQAIANNDFETDLSGWNVSNGAAATVTDLDAHSGLCSLLIQDTVEISQTSVISGMRSPLLSFWRKHDVPFTAELLAGSTAMTITAVQSRLLSPVEDWTFTVLEWSVDEVYIGTIGARFDYDGGPGAAIFIDEVSIAAGFRKVYLPTVMKND